MKTKHILPLIALTLLSGFPALHAQSNRNIGTPDVTVVAVSELESLASGYAAAFAQLPAGAKYVVVSRGEKTEYLGSVRSVRALGGVLLIELESGIYEAISPSDVIKVTNGKPLKN